MKQRTLADYVRAFIGALGMTLRGERIPTTADRFPAYAAWWSETLRRCDALDKLCADHAVDPLAVRVRADGRATALRVIIDAVRFHADTDYPTLFTRAGKYDYMGMVALNLNDRFLVQRLSEHADLPEPVRAAVIALSDHLGAIPPQTESA